MYDTSGEGICYCQSFCEFRSIPITDCDAHDAINGKWNLWRYRTYWNTETKEFDNQWSTTIDQDLKRIRDSMIRDNPTIERDEL